MTTPSPEQVSAWWTAIVGPEYGCQPQHTRLAQEAASWASTAERRACVDHLKERMLPGVASELYAARTCATSGLKQCALSALDDLTILPSNGYSRMAVIRRALESLPDD